MVNVHAINVQAIQSGIAKPRVYTIHQTGKPAVVDIGVNTNPDISATCTVTADGNTLPCT